MEKFSIENESGLAHKLSGLQGIQRIREEADILLNDKKFLETRRGEIWKGAHDILDDLTDLVLLRIKEKYGANEKHSRELVKKIIADHEKVTLKESGDKLILTIKDLVVAEDDLGILKKYGRYPKG